MFACGISTTHLERREMELSVINQQQLSEEMARKPWDVIIVGGGPAGCVAAITVAKRGLRVLLIEKDRYPRDKTCGDALIPDSLGVLRRIGLYDAVLARGMQINTLEGWTPSRITVDVPIECITLKRVVLDTLLAHHAVASGVTIVQATVKYVEPTHSDVRLLTIDGVMVYGRVVLVGTGARAAVSTSHEEALPSSHMVAIRQYVTARADIGSKILIAYERYMLPAYGWVFPMGGSEYNVGCVFFKHEGVAPPSLHSLFREFMEKFPPARALQDGLISMTKPKGFILRCGLVGASPKGAGNVLRIGETLGTTFPYTGEGIGKAMETGEIAGHIAGEALKKGDFKILERYPSTVEALKPRYRGYEIAERWLAYPAVCDYIGRRAQPGTFMNRAIAGIVNETMDPRELFSVKGFMKALVT